MPIRFPLARQPRPTVGAGSPGAAAPRRPPGRAERGRALALAACALVAACGSAGPSPAVDDPIARFRAELADPAVHPVRRGLFIDDEGLRESLRRFGEEHRPLVAARLRESLAALTSGPAPEAPGYQPLVVVEPAELTEIGETLLLIEVLGPDVREVGQRTMSMALPAGMMDDLALPPDVMALWLGFLATAAPTWRRCGGPDERPVVCADYGGLDVFEIALLETDGLLVPTRLTWWQRTDPDVRGEVTR